MWKANAIIATGVHEQTLLGYRGGREGGGGAEGAGACGEGQGVV